MAAGAIAGNAAAIDEAAAGAGYEAELRAAAARHGLPVCGPNGNGIVALHERAALWGDALRPLEPGRVALVSQSGNVAVNTLATRRGLRLHTVVSCGNSVGVDPAEWVAQLAAEEGVGSIAVYLEADGDGAALCEALARCAENGVGVAVLKVGSSAAGVGRGGGPHRRRGRRPARLPRAGGGGRRRLGGGRARAARAGQGAGGARRRGPPAPGRRPGGAHLLGRGLRAGGRRVRAHGPASWPPLGEATALRLRERLPRRGHGGQPARLHRADLGRGRDAARHDRDRGRRRRRRPGARPLRPARRHRGRRGRAWSAGARGHTRRARRAARCRRWWPPPCPSCSTTPPRRASSAPASRRSPGCAPGWCARPRCAVELGDPARLREIAAAAARPAGDANGRRRSPSTRPSSCCAAPACRSWKGAWRRARTTRLAALDELGAPRRAQAVRPVAAAQERAGRAGARPAPRPTTCAPRTAVFARSGSRARRCWWSAWPCPASSCWWRRARDGRGAVSGRRRWAACGRRCYDDVAVVPLPADAERVEAALRSLRGAPLLTGGRGRARRWIWPPRPGSPRGSGELLLERRPRR